MMSKLIHRTLRGLAAGLGVMTALACACGARGEVITLRSEAYVKGPTLLLGDLAEIEGEHAALLSGVEVGPAAIPGATKRIHAALLAARIRSAGIDPASVQIKGPASVHATTLGTELGRATIVESLHDYILANMPWAPGDAEIEIPAPLGDLVLPDGNVEIVWRANPQYRYIGAGGFRGTILVDGRQEKTLMLRATIQAYAEVAVARAELQRGRVIGPADVEMRKEALGPASEGAVRDRAALVGQVTRKSLFAGQIITQDVVEAQKVIKRNQLVAVETMLGGLLIQSQAVAMMDARAGDSITLANPNSKQQFQGVVRADGTVVVR